MTGLETVEIPPAQVITTGGEEELYIIERRDEFFRSVRAAMGLAAIEWDSAFRVKEYQLNHTDWHPTDHRLHELSWGGEVPIAQVRDVRDDFNRHLILFSVFSSLPADIVRQIENTRIIKH